MYLLLVEKGKTKKSHILFIKGLVYRLSHDCHFDIDRDVSTAHYRSSSGDSVDLQIAAAKMQRRWLS